MIDWSLMIRAWVISLSLTLVLELSFSCLWGIRNRHDLILVMLVNILTNPVVVFVLYFIRFRRFRINIGWVTLGMEMIAAATEALLYRKYAGAIDRPWLFSLSANSFSFAMGELINKIM